MAGWKRFDPGLVAKANAPGRIFVIRRPNGKLNVGTIQSMNAEGVTLTSGNWSIFVLFNDGPAKMFTAIDPPQVDVKIGDRKLV